MADFFRNGAHPFATWVPSSVVSGVLFVITVIEILSSVVAQFNSWPDGRRRA